MTQVGERLFSLGERIIYTARYNTAHWLEPRHAATLGINNNKSHKIQLTGFWNTCHQCCWSSCCYWCWVWLLRTQSILQTFSVTHGLVLMPTCISHVYLCTSVPGTSPADESFWAQKWTHWKHFLEPHTRSCWCGLNSLLRGCLIILLAQLYLGQNKLKAYCSEVQIDTKEGAETLPDLPWRMSPRNGCFPPWGCVSQTKPLMSSAISALLQIQTYMKAPLNPIVSKNPPTPTLGPFYAAKAV